MFGEDAQIANQNNRGLTLDNAQVEIINTSWRSQAPDKMAAYKDSYRQSFPIHESAEALPSLDELTERLLIKKHGHRTAYGSSQSLFSQPFKSIEKIVYQRQVASWMGLISDCYSQQALGLLLKNLKSESPNLDKAVQNVRDLFAISTKTLDQFARAEAFMHLMRRKVIVADTELHDFKDLQKAALTSPLSGEGIFGPDFEKKLKDYQEKDKQLSELMPKMNKKQFMKRKSNFQAESNAKKARNNNDSYRSFRNNSSGSSSSFRKSFKQGSHSSNFKNSGKSVVSSFRSQGNRSIEHDSTLCHYPEIPVAGWLRFFLPQQEKITNDQWVLSTIKEGLKLEFLSIPPFSGVKETHVNVQNLPILLEEVKKLLEKKVKKNQLSR